MPFDCANEPRHTRYSLRDCLELGDVEDIRRCIEYNVARWSERLPARELAKKIRDLAPTYAVRIYAMAFMRGEPPIVDLATLIRTDREIGTERAHRMAAEGAPAEAIDYQLRAYVGRSERRRIVDALTCLEAA